MVGLLTSFSGNIRGKGGMGRENQEQRDHSKLQNRGGGQSNGYNVCSQCGVRKYHDAKTREKLGLIWPGWKAKRDQQRICRNTGMSSYFSGRVRVTKQKK